MSRQTYHHHCFTAHTAQGLVTLLRQFDSLDIRLRKLEVMECLGSRLSGQYFVSLEVDFPVSELPVEQMLLLIETHLDHPSCLSAG